MAETAMVIEQLTTDMTDQGEKLIIQLDKIKLLVKAAMWLLDEETGKWRLLLACPEIRTLGPIALYKRVRSILKKMENPPSIQLDRIAIVDPQKSIFRIFADIIQTSNEICGIRFTDMIINGVKINDAYMYRQTIK